MSSKQQAMLTTFSVWLFFIVYAVFRYIVYGTIDAHQVVLFIFNKSLAASASVILAMTVLVGPLFRLSGLGKSALALRPYWGFIGSVMLSFHVSITMVLMSPTYFPKFFMPNDTHFSLPGQWAVLFGLFAFSLMLPLGLSSLSFVRRLIPVVTWKNFHAWAWVAVTAGGIHVTVVAWPSWLTPEKWPQGMLPVTLLVCFFVAASLVVRLSEWGTLLISRFTDQKENSKELDEFSVH